MDLIVADDSKQNNPSRPGMGPLVAIGGIHVPGGAVRTIESAIDEICKSFGFPDPRDRSGHRPNYGEFKWSPNADQWMHDNLHGENRKQFFISVLELLREHDAIAIAVIEDTTRRPADSAQSSGDHEADVTRLFLERADWSLHDCETEGLVIVDRPGDAKKNEDEFLRQSLETLYVGTKYVRFGQVALNVVCTSSHLVRLLQAADLIVGCTTSYVAGESRYSPPVFEQGIRPLLRSVNGCVGGYGLKLHPDCCYANLYHWLLEDTYLFHRGTGLPLPNPHPYSTGPDCP